jgi:hypothetical protein
LLKKILGCFATCSLILTGCSVSDAVKVGDVYVDPPAPLPQQKVTQEDVKKVIDEVTYYDQNINVKLEKPKSAEKAEKIVKKELSKFKIKVKVNPEDESYRNFVSGLLANSAHLTDAERQQLLDYWKYLGKIESKQANERMKELLEKIKSGRGTRADLDELKSLQPIKPGVQLRDRGRPEEEQKTDQPNKDQQENRQPEEEKQQNSDQSDKEQANKSEEEKQSDQSGNRDNGQSSQEEQESADENQSVHNKIKLPKVGVNLGQGENDEKQENEQSDDNQNEEANDDNKEESKNKFGSKDLNKPEKNGYNRYKAQQYAYEWWNKRNNEEFGYYSRINGGCYDCWYDCTSFISQVIYKGGIKQRKEGEIPWFYSDDGPAHAWGVANSKYHHFKGRAKMVDNIWDLKIGDIISFDWDSNDRIDHTAVVTKKDALGVYVTQHTYDRKDAPVMHWLAPIQGVKMYAFDMGSTQND